MKQNKNLFLYLQSLGLLEHGTEEQIERAKQDFKKLQQNSYATKFSQSHKRKSVYLTQKEMSVLMTAAKRHGMRLGTFIRFAALAYVKTEYLLPSDSKIQELEVALRRIGNNINQLTKHVHQRGFTKEDLVAFQQKLNELENRVSDFLRQPLPLKEFLKNLLHQKPEYADVLEKVLKEFRNR
ncbi:plasmid mobilization relaxosome protein MobC [Maribellus comscasis]|uniref:Plasmid mobilization relaxosome protein MobC n=1 Tax=Maribellus comscasis TaxID=2681766 RepID=A0A6I6JPE7_9BACT|nr:plasmid mobilization relaxosome protein MobC [Maribellus comscasis]QGY44846.1 plasmid mobilization relaxosome protein MobC [Maribellus comscasis]